MSGSNEPMLLVVDDNLDEAFLARKRMRKDGIVNQILSEKDPEHVADRLEQLLERGSSVILLLDISMPRVSGFEVLEQLRKNPKYHDIPIIMYSASEDEADILKSLALGADGYLQKPFRTEDFQGVLTNIPQIKTCFLQQAPTPSNNNGAAHAHLTGALA